MPINLNLCQMDALEMVCKQRLPKHKNLSALKMRTLTKRNEQKFIGMRQICRTSRFLINLVPCVILYFHEKLALKIQRSSEKENWNMCSSACSWSVTGQWHGHLRMGREVRFKIDAKAQSQKFAFVRYAAAVPVCSFAGIPISSAKTKRA